MKNLAIIWVVALVLTGAATAAAEFTAIAGAGRCRDSKGLELSTLSTLGLTGQNNKQACGNVCKQTPGCVGYHVHQQHWGCDIVGEELTSAAGPSKGGPWDFSPKSGVGPVADADGAAGYQCYGKVAATTTSAAAAGMCQLIVCLGVRARAF